jgi:ubiquinone/menaquinone biosynthesis C-methylase UbiE
MHGVSGERTAMVGSPAGTTTGIVLHSPVFYDFIVWLAMRGKERAFRKRVLNLARLQAGDSVLDVGCGTGTLAITAKQFVGLQERCTGSMPQRRCLREHKRRREKRASMSISGMALLSRCHFQTLNSMQS